MAERGSGKSSAGGSGGGGHKRRHSSGYDRDKDASSKAKKPKEPALPEEEEDETTSPAKPPVDSYFYFRNHFIEGDNGQYYRFYGKYGWARPLFVPAGKAHFTSSDLQRCYEKCCRLIESFLKTFLLRRRDLVDLGDILREAVRVNVRQPKYPKIPDDLVNSYVKGAADVAVELAAVHLPERAAVDLKSAISENSKALNCIEDVLSVLCCFHCCAKACAFDRRDFVTCSSGRVFGKERCAICRSNRDKRDAASSSSGSAPYSSFKQASGNLGQALRCRINNYLNRPRGPIDFERVHQEYRRRYPHGRTEERASASTSTAAASHAMHRKKKTATASSSAGGSFRPLPPPSVSIPVISISDSPPPTAAAACSVSLPLAPGRSPPPPLVSDFSAVYQTPITIPKNLSFRRYPGKRAPMKEISIETDTSDGEDDDDEEGIGEKRKKNETAAASPARKDLADQAADASSSPPPPSPPPRRSAERESENKAENPTPSTSRRSRIRTTFSTSSSSSSSSCGSCSARSASSSSSSSSSESENESENEEERRQKETDEQKECTSAAAALMETERSAFVAVVTKAPSPRGAALVPVPGPVPARSPSPVSPPASPPAADRGRTSPAEQSATPCVDESPPSVNLYEEPDASTAGDASSLSDIRELDLMDAIAVGNVSMLDFKSLSEPTPAVSRSSSVSFCSLLGFPPSRSSSSLEAGLESSLLSLQKAVKELAAEQGDVEAEVGRETQQRQCERRRSPTVVSATEPQLQPREGERQPSPARPSQVAPDPCPSPVRPSSPVPPLHLPRAHPPPSPPSQLRAHPPPSPPPQTRPVPSDGAPAPPSVPMRALSPIPISISVPAHPEEVTPSMEFPLAFIQQPLQPYVRPTPISFADTPLLSTVVTQRAGEPPVFQSHHQPLPLEQQQQQQVTQIIAVPDSVFRQPHPMAQQVPPAVFQPPMQMMPVASLMPLPPPPSQMLPPPPQQQQQQQLPARSRPNVSSTPPSSSSSPPQPPPPAFLSQPSVSFPGHFAGPPVVETTPYPSVAELEDPAVYGQGLSPERREHYLDLYNYGVALGAVYQPGSPISARLAANCQSLFEDILANREAPGSHSSGWLLSYLLRRRNLRDPSTMGTAIKAALDVVTSQHPACPLKYFPVFSEEAWRVSLDTENLNDFGSLVNKLRDRQTQTAVAALGPSMPLAELADQLENIGQILCGVGFPTSGPRP